MTDFYTEDIELKYGMHSLQLPATAPSSHVTLLPTLPNGIVDTEDYINTILDSPIDSQPFNEKFKKNSRVVIIISDITRTTASEIYLPIIINRLNQTGIPDKNITFVCALAIHRKHTTEEHKKLIGSTFLERFTIIDHDAFDKDTMITLGKTTRGTTIEVNRLVAEADHVILTGGIRFHYFAGFSGGRKSILPGVSAFNSCVANHLLVLNQNNQGGRHPLARTGILKGNPVHEDMAEACNHLSSLFLFNTILSPQKKLLKAVSGDPDSAFNHGCRFFKEHFSAPVTQKADLVIASCGGNPWDINFIQAHKTIDMAVNALKEGGALILLAECSQGFGNPRFLKWFDYLDPREFENKLRANYEINGQTAYATFLKALKYHIILISSLQPDEVEKMSFIPASSFEEALEIAYRKIGTPSLTYIIPEGSSFLPLTI
jgi:nickel-dependent lactate racemase